MRRGTPAAKVFGNVLLKFRMEAGLSQRQVGAVIKAPAATVSQTEKGQRALKEPKLSIWAKALGVKEEHLRELWLATQIEEDPPIVRGRAKKTKELESLISELRSSERSQVFGYVQAVIEQRRLSDDK